jgi:dTDP-4-dehydrorhamnose 3,5-epimerase-like enzyme
MNIKLSKILSLKLIYPFSIFKDNRGTYTEVFNKKKWGKSI